MKVILLLILTCGAALAQTPANYDESGAGDYVLPDPLRLGDGTMVNGPQDWRQMRRPQLLALFSEHIYGLAPDKAVKWTAESSSETVFGGKAIRMLVSLKLRCEGRELVLPLLIYRPSEKRARGVFLGLNFGAIKRCTRIPPYLFLQAGSSTARIWESSPIVANRATEQSRGGRARRWPVEAMVDRGYALCTLAYGDLEPDVKEGFGSGVHRFLGDEQVDSWGAIAAWAWGLSRVADFVEKETWAGPMAVVVALGQGGFVGRGH